MGADRRPWGAHPPLSSFSSFFLWVLTTSWSCSPPGSDSDQGSDVSLRVPKGETLGCVDWKGDGAEVTYWVAEIFEWDM